jgi:S-adenosylmethionine synthetase
MSNDYLFVSESVTEGHPDKLCDQISDALVDEFLFHDPAARVEAECAVANGIVFIGAHYNSAAVVEVAEVARSVIAAAGYAEGEFNAADCTILTSLSEVDFLPRAAGHDEGEAAKFVAEQHATVFGFACRQTPQLMPLPISLAHRLARRLDTVRSESLLDYLLPDAKVQVAVVYDGPTPRRVHSVSLVTSVDAGRVASQATLTDDVVDAVVVPVFADEELGLDRKTRILINHDGALRAGGPARHSGLTGRKNAVDTYGEYARHSGAALSGKDALRIDRVGAYAARHAAKNVVAAGLADECEVQLSYTIGFAPPASLHVRTFGTGRIDDGEIADRVREHFEFRPLGIVRAFGLDASTEGPGRFRRLATYGHMGRVELDAPWEATDEAGRLA